MGPGTVKQRGSRFWAHFALFGSQLAPRRLEGAERSLGGEIKAGKAAGSALGGLRTPRDPSGSPRCPQGGFWGVPAAPLPFFPGIGLNSRSPGQGGRLRVQQRGQKILESPHFLFISPTTPTWLCTQRCCGKKGFLTDFPWIFPLIFPGFSP